MNVKRKMKPQQKALLIFILLVVAIMLNNFSNWRNYNNLSKNFSSIYKDRIMPSGYIYQLHDHLYQKKLLLQQPDIPKAEKAAAIAQHNKEVTAIIKAYENTYLTPAEKQHWHQFKNNLLQYNITEAGHLVNMHATDYDLGTLQQHFIQSQEELKKLSKLQATEADLLGKDSHYIINSSRIQTYLELILLMILIVAGIIIITRSSQQDSNFYNYRGLNSYN
jgi:hypothetical protein